MPRNIGLVIALGALVVVFFSGCAAEDVPHAPTYAADVLPIMLSRCVRCHGGGGTLNDDLGIASDSPLKGAPFDGYFDHMEDQGTCVDDQTATPPCKRGLLFYATNRTSQLQVYIHSTTSLRMPLPPAPPLTDRQLEVMDNWIAEKPPM
jgi:hypothetical protein